VRPRKGYHGFEVPIIVQQRQRFPDAAGDDVASAPPLQHVAEDAEGYFLTWARKWSIPFTP
jgi:hypothetical protein